MTQKKKSTKKKAAPKQKVESKTAPGLKPLLDIDEVVVKKLSPTLIEEYESYRIKQESLRAQLYKITDIVYSKTLDKDLLPDKAGKVFQMIRAAFINGREFPADLASEVKDYLRMEREVTLAEWTFWYNINQQYDLWLVPGISLRGDYAVIKLPISALKRGNNDRTP